MVRSRGGVCVGDIVRRSKGGKFIGWSVRFKDSDGKRKIRASHQPTRELARRFLVEIEARIARGQVGLPEPAPISPTLNELCERFLTEYDRPRIKDLTLYRSSARRALQRFLPALGSRPADAIKPADIAAARDAGGRSWAPASVRIGLSYLAAVYAWGIKLDVVKNNPVKEVERPSCQPSLDYFDRAEVTQLLAQVDEWAGNISACRKSLIAKYAAERRLTACCLRVALHAGLRKGELLGLRWRDLDLDTLRLTIARSFTTTPKSGKARHLRLPSSLVPVLREWRKFCPTTPAGLVFPINKQALDRHTVKLFSKAQVRIPLHPWHALRHTFASHFIMAGGNILTLQKILGHSDVKMTMIYAHLAPDFLGTEMERVKF